MMKNISVIGAINASNGKDFHDRTHGRPAAVDIVVRIEDGKLKSIRPALPLGLIAKVQEAIMKHIQTGETEIISEDIVVRIYEILKW